MVLDEWQRSAEIWNRLQSNTAAFDALRQLTEQLDQSARLYERTFQQLRGPTRPLADLVSPKFVCVEWVGSALMPDSLLAAVMRASKEQAATMIESWVNGNRASLADEFVRRLHSYQNTPGIDELCVTAVGEAADSYRRGHFLSVVRTLMPECERFGRAIRNADGTLPRKLREAVDQLKEYMANALVQFYHPLEGATIYPFLARQLFAHCQDVADAQALGALPNRHAELHGFASYGDLRGATALLACLDVLLATPGAWQRYLKT